MIHYNIMGDETVDPMEFVHCVKCRREVPGPDTASWDEMECVCGAPLVDAESLITGAMIHREEKAIERKLAEWTALNTKPPAMTQPGDA